jgi:hypothetical protein
MLVYAVTVCIFFAMLVTYVLVERVYRRYATQHPELGPFRSESGCGCCKGCDDGTCDADIVKKQKLPLVL